MTVSNNPRIALLGACALALSACGGGSEETASAPAANDAGAVAPAAEVDYASLTGDPAHGEQLFAQCRVCHTVEEGANRVGPSLHAIVGRAAGSVEGFAYSDANRDSGITWTEQALFDYLRDPRGAIPGTTMAFAGFPEAQDRADLIAYLETRR